MILFIKYHLKNNSLIEDIKMKKVLSTMLALTVMVGSGTFANAAQKQKLLNANKSHVSYCDKELNKHRRMSLFQTNSEVKLDTISCHSDTGYDNDHDFGGKDLTKGDAK